MSSPQVSLRGVLRVLWAHWVTLAIFAGTFGALSVIYALTRTPLYESISLLAPANAANGQISSLGGMLGQLSGLAGGLGFAGGGASENEVVAVLQSREFALRFIQENDMLPIMFPSLWDKKHQRWRSTSEKGGVRKGPLSDDVVRAFDRVRTVIVDRSTRFIRLVVHAPSPTLAHTWASAMIAEINEVMRKRSLKESQRAVKLLSKSVETEQVESIRVAAAALLEAQLRREVLAQSRTDYALRVLDPPSLPDQRFYPKRTRMVIIGTGLGFLFGCIFVLAIRAWRNGA